MALHLKNAADQSLVISGQIPSKIEDKTILSSIIFSTYNARGILPEDDEPVLPVFERWISYGVQILGKTREWMIRAILTWAGFAKLAGITEIDYTELNIPGFTYRYNGVDLSAEVPSIYGFSGDFNDNTLFSALPTLIYRTNYEDINSCCNELYSDALVDLIEDLGYTAANTTVAQLRAQVSDLEAWLSIAAWVIQGGNDFFDVWDNWDTCLDAEDDSYLDYTGSSEGVPGAMLMLNRDSYFPMREGFAFVPLDADKTKFVVLNWEPRGTSYSFDGSMFLYYKLGEETIKLLMAHGEPLWEVLANSEDQPMPLSESMGLTLEELVSAWPDKFSKFVYDDAPVGLSATKKHFIRVI